MAHLDQNHCVFVHEDGLWAIKGPYEKALLDDEEIEWDCKNGTCTLHILVVSLSSFDLRLHCLTIISDTARSTICGVDIFIDSKFGHFHHFASSIFY